MFSPASARAASSYRKASVDGASPYQLINLLFERTLQSLRAARASLSQGDAAAKGTHIGLAVRYIEEGLKLGLNPAQGGELASNLGTLYDYCVRRLTVANLRNDDAPLVEVIDLLAPVAESWRAIAGEAQQVRPLAAMGA